uniref:rRNA biogenesis protein RRP36 n=1 Tax=Ficedula albicollis TaxID=59894 RepID=A0A803VAF7_FICAL
MSAKKPVPFLRQVVPVRKKVGAAPPRFRASLSAADRAHTWQWGYCRWDRLLLEDRAGLLESADSHSVSLGRTMGGLEQLQVNLRSAPLKCIFLVFRPLEMSAKKPVPFLRQVVPVRKKVGARDPRFDDLSGEYKPEIFMKTYTFLDTIKKQEKEMVQKQLKKCRNMEEKEKLQRLLNRMTQQEQAQKKQQKLRERELSLKRQQRELAKQGKKPFFLKKSEKRKLELAEKYAELKRSGKLESFLNKKRKRNAIKDKRHLPSQKNL